MPDLVVNYFRKDVFCDDTEQKNFKAKYNYKLPCTPEEMDQITWDNYKDIGEFFKRKKGEMLMGKPLDDDFYGVEFQVGKGYDFFTTSAYEFLWQHGGDIWDETKQPNAHAVGVVNSPVRGQVLRAPPVLREVYAAGGDDRQSRHLQDG